METENKIICIPALIIKNIYMYKEVKLSLLHYYNTIITVLLPSMVRVDQLIYRYRL